METRSCQNCRQDFIIEPNDFGFYEKVKVPPPTWCPECRIIRRFSFENTWNLFWRNCDKCQKKTLSLYSPEQEITVYCQPCWWKDDWDGTEYAMDYDPSRNFLEQVKELNDKTPYASLTSLYTSIKNCDYANALAWSKDCYLIFWADFCDTVYYSSLLNTLKNSLDCIRGYFSELCYESIGLGKCYRTFFSEECDDCIDVWFSRNCYNCSDCVGCVNLSGAKNSIFNVKYSKEEYEQKIKELELDTWDGIQKTKNLAYTFWQTLPYRAYKGHSLNLNVSGDYIFESKNSTEMYLANGAENCKWCQFITVKPAKDCMDYSGWGNNASRIYESTVVGENSDSVYFSTQCWPDSMNLEYCCWNISGKNNLGCINLKRKEYCILNKQYTKEEYIILKQKIIQDMKVTPYTTKTGQKFYYGEFFPPEFSKFPYNKSNAMRFFPKTKEQALVEGYFWDETIHENSPTTINSSQLPVTISETTESILSEVIECNSCSRPYKIVAGELNLMKKLNLPIPHECPKCRENKRFARLDPIKLYKRNCQKCSKEISTPYAPDRSEIVYCEKCYQQEVY